MKSPSRPINLHHLTIALLILLGLPDRNQCAPAVEDEDVEGGCYYMFNHYGEGDRILTNEPCLNCTCHNSMLMCYLRVCPFTKPIGQDCTIEKKPDQCCPVITCPQVPVSLVTPSALVTTTSTTTAATVSSSEVALLDRGCEMDGKYYPDGAQVASDASKPCELCYCIRNRTACVMQECILHVEGCKPIFESGVCCPVRYQCDGPMEIETTTQGFGNLISTTISNMFGVVTSTPQPGGCIRDGQYYADGSQIPNPEEDACNHCYCMRGDIVCAVQECGSPLENEGGNCTAIAPRKGLCCPEKYACQDTSIRQGKLFMHTKINETTDSPMLDDGSTGQTTLQPVIESRPTESGIESQHDDASEPTTVPSSSESNKPSESDKLPVGSTNIPTEDEASSTTAPKISNLNNVTSSTTEPKDTTEKDLSDTATTLLPILADDKPGKEEGHEATTLAKGIESGDDHEVTTLSSASSSSSSEPEALNTHPVSSTTEAGATLASEATTIHMDVHQPGENDKAEVGGPTTVIPTSEHNKESTPKEDESSSAGTSSAEPQTTSPSVSQQDIIPPQDSITGLPPSVNLVSSTSATTSEKEIETTLSPDSAHHDSAADKVDTVPETTEASPEHPGTQSEDKNKESMHSTTHGTSAEMILTTTPETAAEDAVHDDIQDKAGQPTTVSPHESSSPSSAASASTSEAQTVHDVAASTPAMDMEDEVPHTTISPAAEDKQSSSSASDLETTVPSVSQSSEHNASDAEHSTEPTVPANESSKVSNSEEAVFVMTTQKMEPSEGSEGTTTPPRHIAPSGSPTEIPSSQNADETSTKKEDESDSTDRPTTMPEHFADSTTEKLVMTNSSIPSSSLVSSEAPQTQTSSTSAAPVTEHEEPSAHDDAVATTVPTSAVSHESATGSENDIHPTTIQSENEPEGASTVQPRISTSAPQTTHSTAAQEDEGHGTTSSVGAEASTDKPSEGQTMNVEATTVPSVASAETETKAPTSEDEPTATTVEPIGESSSPHPVSTLPESHSSTPSSSHDDTPTHSDTTEASETHSPTSPSVAHTVIPDEVEVTTLPSISSEPAASSVTTERIIPTTVNPAFDDAVAVPETTLSPAEQHQASESSSSTARPEHNASESSSSSVHPEENATESSSSSAHPEESATESSSSSAHPEESATESSSSSAHPEQNATESSSSTAHPEENATESSSSSAHPEQSATESSSSSAHPEQSASEGSASTSQPEHPAGSPASTESTQTSHSAPAEASTESHTSQHNIPTTVATPSHDEIQEKIQQNQVSANEIKPTFNISSTEGHTVIIPEQQDNNKEPIPVMPLQRENETTSVSASSTSTTTVSPVTVSDKASEEPSTSTPHETHPSVDEHHDESENELDDHSKETTVHEKVPVTTPKIESSPQPTVQPETSEVPTQHPSEAASKPTETLPADSTNEVSSAGTTVPVSEVNQPTTQSSVDQSSSSSSAEPTKEQEPAGTTLLPMEEATTVQPASIPSVSVDGTATTAPTEELPGTTTSSVSSEPASPDSVSDKIDTVSTVDKIDVTTQLPTKDAEDSVTTHGSSASTESSSSSSPSSSVRPSTEESDSATTEINDLPGHTEGTTSKSVESSSESQSQSSTENSLEGSTASAASDDIDETSSSSREPEEFTSTTVKHTSDASVDAGSSSSSSSEDKETSSTTASTESEEITTHTDAPGVRIPGEGSCFVEGVTYRNGSRIPPSTPCQLACACQNSIVHCLLVHCPPPPSDTGDCKPVYKAGICCPKYECDATSSAPSVTVTPEPDQKEASPGEGLVTVTGRPVPSTESVTAENKADNDTSTTRPDVVPTTASIEGSPASQTSQSEQHVTSANLATAPPAVETSSHPSTAQSEDMSHQHDHSDDVDHPETTHMPEIITVLPGSSVTPETSNLENKEATTATGTLKPQTVEAVATTEAAPSTSTSVESHTEISSVSSSSSSSVASISSMTSSSTPAKANATISSDGAVNATTLSPSSESAPTVDEKLGQPHVQSNASSLDAPSSSSEDSVKESTPLSSSTSPSPLNETDAGSPLDDSSSTAGSKYPVTTTTSLTPSPAPWPYPSSSTASPSASMSSGACLFDGRVYMSAQQIPRDDPCDFCFCFRGDIICLQQSCPPPIPGCYEEPIPGFCCPRYECPVGSGNSTTAPPLFPPSYYHSQILNNAAQPTADKGVVSSNMATGPGCEISGEYYETGQLIVSTSGPCLECRCSANGMMDCQPRECQPEPMLRKMLAAITSR